MSARKPKPTSVSTLGDLRDSEMGLTVHCGSQNCGHHEDLPLEPLIARLGEDWKYIGRLDIIAKACRCRQCGHKGASMRLWSDTKPRYG